MAENKVEGKHRLHDLIQEKEINQDLEGLDYYLVGGAVRDAILGNEIKDLDFVVVHHTPVEMKKRGFKEVEADFPVFLDSEDDEWALARKEKKTGKGYHGFDVYSSPDVTLEEDLKRRDFTINAMAYNPEENQIIDIYGGIGDLSNGVVRHVSDAYAEDPLRILRLARFSARLGFEPHKSTIDLSREIVHEIEDIPNQRIFSEFKKAMLQAKNPRRFFEILKEVHVFHYIIPEVLKLQEVPSGKKKYHGDATAWEHTMMTVDEMYKLEGNNPMALLIAFFHDIGKGQTPKSALPHHYEHPKTGAEMVKNILRDLRFPNKYVKMISTVTREHMKFNKIPDMRDSTVIKFVEDMDKVGHEPHTALYYLKQLYLADMRGRRVELKTNISKIEERIERTRKGIENIRGDVVVEEYPHLEGEEIYDQLLEMRVEELRKLRNKKEGEKI